jgi:hypothetical protein
MKRAHAWIASAVAITVCSVSFAPIAAASNTPKQTTKQVKALLDKWDETLSSSECGDGSAMAALYRPKAVLHAHDGNARGRGDIKTYYNALTCLPDLEVTLESWESGGDGDVLWATGISNNAFTFEGQPLNVPLRFTYVWEKSPDGTYRIVAHQSSGTGPTGTIPS